jgi:hypothetical protein
VNAPTRLLLALLWLLPTVAGAAFDVDVLAGSDAQNGDVAYNSTDDEFLLVWKDGSGAIRGQVRRSDTSVVVADVALFQGLRSTLKYSVPRASFKTGQNQYVVVARELDTGGPLPAERIVIAGFNRLGARQWIRSLTNGLITVRNPDVVADTFGSVCCILAVWEEGFGSIRGQQLNADGTLQGAALTIFSGSSEFPPHAMNPSVAYQRLPTDSFAVAYQVLGSSRVAVRRVTPVSGALGAEVPVSPMSEAPPRGQRFNAGTALTYNETADRYLVAWADNGATFVQRLTPDLNPPGPRFSLGLSKGNPAAASAVGDARDVVTVGRDTSAGKWMQAVYVGDTPTSYVTLVSPRTELVIQGAAAFSPVSRRFLYTWQENETGFIGFGNVRGDTLGLF